MFKGLDRWLFSYARQWPRRRVPRADEPVHMLLCIADHFEPGNGGVDFATARARVAAWGRDYPKMLGDLRDSDGRPPRHTFFYPMEQYVESDLDALAELCRAGFGEVGIHLHHDKDTADNLRANLLTYKTMLANRHGLLARNQAGEIEYGFVHGDWALDNSLPDGSCCGVTNELDVLRETGCYADFTLPAAPSPAQTKKINSIYYATDGPKPKSHNYGVDVGSRNKPAKSLMLIQGPLGLNWRKRKWGIIPRIENACVQANQAMAIERVDSWLAARVQIKNRPDWFFVKLHTHGAPEANARMLWGEPAVRFHRDLAARAKANPNFHYHYVTSREMCNLALAAEANWRGSVADALDYRLTWNSQPPVEEVPVAPGDLALQNISV